MPGRTTSITVTYQSRATIDAALSPFREACSSGRHMCVVVDNDSADGTAEHVAKAHPYARLIRARQNLGFGRGCNLGANGCRSEFLLFLNPDASLAPQELDKLLAFMDAHPRVGVCAPSIEASLQRAGMKTRPGDVIAQAWGLPGYAESRLIVPGTAPFQTSWVCGAVFVMRTSLYRALGGFDPRFFLYFEETDLFLRAMHAGAEVWVVPEARASHRAGASAHATQEQTIYGDVAKHFFQSRFYYLSKHHGLASAIAADLLELHALTIRAVLGRAGRDKLRERVRATLLRPPRKLSAKLVFTGGAGAGRSAAVQTNRGAR
jgi:GT2 family glycosyltransferase